MNQRIPLWNQKTINDCFSDLGIPPTSRKKEIKKAYYDLAKQHHPDVGGDSDTFKTIQESYERLMAINLIKNISVRLDLQNFLHGCYINLTENNQTIKLYVPPFTLPKTLIKFSNKDLTDIEFHVRLLENKQSAFKRHRADLYIDRFIESEDALNGTIVQFKNFDNEDISISIPKGTNASMLVYILERKGFFDETLRRGRLIVNIQIEKRDLYNVRQY